jgi:hypothetical protein
MLSLDFADIAIINMIAIAKIITSIVPNSGTTCFGIHHFTIINNPT